VQYRRERIEQRNLADSPYERTATATQRLNITCDDFSLPDGNSVEGALDWENAR
jgi:hypothetical protein